MLGSLFFTGSECWPAGNASIKGTTAFENTTLYSQSTCSHLRFTHIIRPTRNTADPYDTTTELSPINKSTGLFLDYSLGLVILQARVEHWQQATTGGMTRRKPMVNIYFENNYSMPANSNTSCTSFMPGELFLDLDFTHQRGQFLTPDKQIRWIVL